MFELVDAAEAWGLDIVWLAEMMVNPARSVLSAPLLVASWIVARTQRVRVGTAVQLLPLNHPAARRRRDHHARPPEPGALRLRHRAQRLHPRLRRARRAVRREPGALLRGARDHPEILEGRAVQLRGQVLPVHRRRRCPLARIGRRTRRCAWRRRRRRRSRVWGAWACRSSSACAAWTSPSWPATCASTARRGARRGIPAMATRACVFPIYAAPTEKAALEEPRETITYYFERQADLTRAPIGRAGTGPVEQRQTQAQRLATAVLRRDPRQEGRLRHRSGAGRPPRAAPRRAGRDRGRRRAEPRRAPADGAGAAQPRDPHQAGDARVQVGSVNAPRDPCAASLALLS